MYRRVVNHYLISYPAQMYLQEDNPGALLPAAAEIFRRLYAVEEVLPCSLTKQKFLNS